MAWFKDAEHFKSVCGYEINGGWYPRVTQILSIKAKPALEFFFKEVGSYAAAVDALATIGGKFGVLDIKTSTGFYPEYNLQTAAYVLALQELDLKRALKLPGEIATRWILRVDQQRQCLRCGAS